MTTKAKESDNTKAEKSTTRHRGVDAALKDSTQ